MTTDDDTLALRADAIRELTQGRGLTREATGDVDPDVLRAFDVRDGDQLYDLVVWTQHTLGEGDEAVAAIRTALGLTRTTLGLIRDSTGTSLAKRRKKTQEDQGIAYRSVIRREQDGAEKLAAQVESARELVPTPNDMKLLGITRSWRAGDLDPLAQQMNELYEIVMETQEAAGTISQKVAEALAAVQDMAQRQEERIAELEQMVADLRGEQPPAVQDPGSFVIPKLNLDDLIGDDPEPDPERPLRVGEKFHNFVTGKERWQE